MGDGPKNSHRELPCPHFAPREIVSISWRAALQEKVEMGTGCVVTISYDPADPSRSTEDRSLSHPDLVRGTQAPSAHQVSAVENDLLPGKSKPNRGARSLPSNDCPEVPIWEVILWTADDLRVTGVISYDAVSWEERHSSLRGAFSYAESRCYLIAGLSHPS